MGLLADSMVAVEITTAADGSFTGFTPVVSGKVINVIRFVDTDLADTADFTITEEETGQVIMIDADIATDMTWNPGPVTHLPTDGSVNATVKGIVSIGHSRIQVVIAQGGDTKTGTVFFDLISR